MWVNVACGCLGLGLGLGVSSGVRMELELKAPTHLHGTAYKQEDGNVTYEPPKEFAKSEPHFFDMYRRRSTGTVLTTIVSEDGQRVYLDFEEQEWRPLPDEWLPDLERVQVKPGHAALKAPFPTAATAAATTITITTSPPIGIRIHKCN